MGRICKEREYKIENMKETAPDKWYRYPTNMDFGNSTIRLVILLKKEK
jgi:hypothetical protein